MSVELPIRSYLDAVPGMLDFGGILTPPTGGEEQRVNRLGNRFTLQMTVDTDTEAEARILLQRLLRAQTEGALMPWPAWSMNVGQPGAPQVDGAVSGGKTLPIKGLSPYYAIREGQPLSIIIDGRRYMHTCDAEVIADETGDAEILVTPMLRKALAGDEVIELAKPMIEGALDGDGRQWQIAAGGAEPFVFMIREMA